MNPRVVVADDNVAVRQFLASLVEGEAGLDLVGAAGDGAEALDLARLLEPDILLMDIQMPEFSGIEATRRIAAEGLPCRVIGVSRYEDSRFVRTLFAAGAWGYVLKAGLFGEIVRAIHAVMARKIYLSPKLGQLADLASRERAGSEAWQALPVRFLLDAPTASEVHLRGDFDDWAQPGHRMKPVEAGRWIKHLWLTPGTYEYRYLVDGEWHEEPRAEVIGNSFGTYNLLLSVA